MKGVDSDNGGEFKNNQLYNWCVNNKILFTRSRSYHKNDNCFVEEKNYSVVRKLVGYARYEGADTLGVMSELYENYCTLVNYFYPSVKIIEKERVGARTKKKYDIAKTPYARCLEAQEITALQKQELHRRKQDLDVVELKQEVNRLLNVLLPPAETQ